MKSKHALNPFPIISSQYKMKTNTQVLNRNELGKNQDEYNSVNTENFSSLTDFPKDASTELS